MLIKYEYIGGPNWKKITGEIELDKFSDAEQVIKDLLKGQEYLARTLKITKIK